MEIDKASWDNFVRAHGGSILQYSFWGDLQETAGSNIIAIEGEHFKALAKQKTFPLGVTGLNVSYGPVISSDTGLREFTDTLKKRPDSFVLASFSLPKEKNYELELKKLGWKAAKADEPESTQIIDLSLDEKSLYEAINKTVRYEIRQAEAGGVSLTGDAEESGLEDFLKLLEKTTERQKFRSHDPGYLRTSFSFLRQQGRVRIFRAQIEGKTIAACLVYNDDETAYYMHAASDGISRKFKPANLVMWAAIRDAKARGFKTFDLWGVAPADDPKHPWAGLSFFKKRFGGTQVDYVGGYVLVLHPLKYALYQAGKSLNRGLR